MAKKNNEEEIYEFLDKTKLYEQLINKDISEEESKQFIQTIMENYYLDNDNINFLIKNGFSFFEFKEDEPCFCLSGKNYGLCCFKKIKKEKVSTYKTLSESIVDKKLYEDYLGMMSNISNLKIEEWIKNQKCFYPNCNRGLSENFLYSDAEFNENKLVGSIRKNMFDVLINENISNFNIKIKEDYNFYGLCKEHDDIINSAVVDSNEDVEKIIDKSFKTLLYKYTNEKIKLECLKEEFINYFNSIELNGFKAYLVFNLRKASKYVSSMFKELMFYIDSIAKGDFTQFKILDFKLKSLPKFSFSGVIEPQTTPKDFKLINSFNNIFVDKNYITMNLFKTNDSCLSIFVYNKNNTKLNIFFDQYKEELKSTKEIQSFITNCSLILSDEILINEQKFNSFELEDQKLISAFNKIRFITPENGKEYVMLKFYSGFTRGWNLF